MVMEVHNKTKRRLAKEDMEAEGNTNTLKKLKKGKEEEEEEEAAAGDAAPTEEEVDEFFAILRRMKVAVDYFDQKRKGGKEWREVLEQADRRESDGAAVKKSAGGEVIVNEGFDLNIVAPEAADAST